ncbi:hypothetical protein EUZ93_03920 [Wolbachia pipientis]|nr:hypothetical protein [Wolbachia pipientis]
MNNEKASTEEAIGNDYRRSKMGKRSKQRNKKNGAQINGKQPTNPSNAVLSVQPTTPETPNASSSENSFQLEGDQDTQPLLLQSSVSGDEHSGTPSNPSSECVVNDSEHDKPCLKSTKEMLLYKIHNQKL